MSGIDGNCHCGAVRWHYRGVPASATACNCTVCGRYGALWAYGAEGEVVTVEGPTARYIPEDALAFHFCTTCGCLTHYSTLQADDSGAWPMAVNLRMSDPELIADLPMRRWDGRVSWAAADADGRVLADHWY